MALTEVTVLVPTNVIAIVHLNDHGGDPAAVGEGTLEVLAVDADGRVLATQRENLFDLVSAARRTQVLAFMAEVRALALQVLP